MSGTEVHSPSRDAAVGKVDSQVSAPTRFAEANGVRYAYRRFGAPSRTPLLFLQHLRGGMDHWDPAVTDGLAAGRPVILFDNTGVAASSGQTPATMEGFADHAAAFAAALGLTQVDVLGFSIGGHAAQALAMRHPRLVRRLVIAGSKPPGGRRRGNPPGRPRGREPPRGAHPGGLPVPVLRADADQPGSGPGVLAAAPPPHCRRRPAHLTSDHAGPDRRHPPTGANPAASATPT
jgi:pimeloyl-ACP methyl ester carboxylesterase